MRQALSVIDGNTNTVVASVPVAVNARGVAVNSRTNRIYVVIGGNPYVQVIDGPTNTVIADIIHPGNFYAATNSIAVNTEANRIYVPDFNTHTIGIIEAV
jgi:DNA-binding beta-propeller fold protein YncE